MSRQRSPKRSDGLRIHVLGPLEVAVDGAPLVVDTRKALAILALLAVERRPFAREELAALLWPDSDDESARGALRRTLSVLRASLGDRWLRIDRSTVAVDVPGLAEQIRSGEVRVLDVREEGEWEQSHVPGSIHIPFHELRDGVPDELENGGKPLAIVCSAGNRSSIAASLLKRAGLEGVEHVAEGGVEDLRNEGIELAKGK